MHFFKFLTAIFVFTLAVNLTYSQAVPELIYYRFHGNSSTTTTNFASSPVGTNPAPYSLETITGGGQFDSCMVGNGSVGTAGVLPGWNCNLTGSWTISMWVSNLNETLTGNPTYLFGDPGSTAFRCFYGGFALPNNAIIRGPFADLIFPCPMPGSFTITLVYNGTTLTVYNNGVQVAQATMTITLPTGTGFRVAGYTGGAYALKQAAKWMNSGYITEL